MPPTNRVPVRFLSRYDKSATNIKESLLFCTIGQVRIPWTLDVRSNCSLSLGPLGVRVFDMVPPIRTVPASSTGRSIGVVRVYPD